MTERCFLKRTDKKIEKSGSRRKDRANRRRE